MKTTPLLFLLLAGCTTTTTVTRVTDAKGGMTETTTTVKGADVAALKVASDIAISYAPRGRVVYEK